MLKKMIYTIFRKFIFISLLSSVLLSKFPDAIGYNGMVVSSNEYASNVGIDILKKGGNAIDAAIGVSFALAVVHPGAGNIGGGGFMVIRTSDGEVSTIDFRETAPSKAYKRIKIKTSSKRFMAILKEVAGWREIMAQKQDVPRGRIIKDETLIEIAHHTPKTSEQLSKLRGLGKHLAAGKASQMLLEAIYAGKTMPDLMCPSIPAKTELPKGIGPIVDLLKVLLKLKSEEFKVAGKLLANSNEINQIAAFGEHADVRALKGWRREIFGDDALSLKTGKSYLTVEKNKLCLVTRSNNSKK